MNESTPHTPLQQAFRVILILGLLCVALGLALVYSLLRPGSPPTLDLQDPAVREEAVRRLVQAGSGLYDSHSDAEVGRILQPNIRERSAENTVVSSNAYGLREREYALPKPSGTVRVVLLGDSFVFGYGVAAEDRLGVHLERWLREKAQGFDGEIECLHIGVTSWDIPTAATYLRRQLGDMQPDLVIHISLPNDIEGTVGVRGFGTWSRFYPRFRHRADSVIRTGFAVHDLGFSRLGYLRYGLDHEGRSRYADAVDHIRTLTGALEQAGASYRMLLNYRHLQPLAHRFLGPYLPPEQLVYLSADFGTDRKYWNSPEDLHWNPDGHRLVAQMLYGLIVQDDLLPQLQLPPWTEAEDALREIVDRVQREDFIEQSLERILQAHKMPKPKPRIDFNELTPSTASQIHGGIDSQNRTSPYAAFVLRNIGTELQLTGSAFDRPELDGAAVRISIDEREVGQRRLESGKDFEWSFPIPAGFEERPYLGVRLESEDYIYATEDLQHCVVFVLKSAAIR